MQLAVTAEISKYTATIEDLAIAVGAQSDLSTSDFSTLTSKLNGSRLPGASGVALVVPASDAEIPDVLQYWRAKGDSRLVLSPVGTGVEHLFVVRNRALDGSPTKPGRDLSQATEPTQALLLARSRRQVTASSTYVLLKDRDLPAGDQQLSFVLAAPVYGGGGTPDAGQFRGWILMGLRGQDFLHATLRASSQQTVSVTLLDASTSVAAPVPVAQFSGGPVDGQEYLRRDVAVDVAGRLWQLRVQPAAGFTVFTGPSLMIPTVVAGILLTLVLAALVAALSTSRLRALTQVEVATAALRDDLRARQVAEAEVAILNTQLERRVVERTAQLQTSIDEQRAFTYSVSHDLRTPLRALVGFSQLVLEEYANVLDDDGTSYLTRINAAATRMGQIIDDLLRLTRTSSGELRHQDVDLGAIADTIHQELQSLQPDRTVHLTLKGPLDTRGDELLLTLAMQNLMANAWKFSSRRSPAAITVGCLQRDDQNVFFVQDNGAGFDPQYAQKLFEPFQRLHAPSDFEGTGIGLAIVQRVIQRHGGEVWGESTPGLGATFFFTLTETDIPRTVAAPAAGPDRILVEG